MVGFLLLDAMLSRFGKTARIKAALAVGLLYAFCVLAPHAAVALGLGDAHCLTETPSAAHIHPDSAQPHTHSHGDAHHDAQHVADEHGIPAHDHGKGKDHSANCCGLFCVSAIAQTADAMTAPPHSASTRLPASVEVPSGRGPSRIIRPPIA